MSQIEEKPFWMRYVCGVCIYRTFNSICATIIIYHSFIHSAQQMVFVASPYAAHMRSARRLSSVAVRTEVRYEIRCDAKQKASSRRRLCYARTAHTGRLSSLYFCELRGYWYSMHSVSQHIAFDLEERQNLPSTLHEWNWQRLKGKRETYDAIYIEW